MFDLYENRINTRGSGNTSSTSAAPSQERIDFSANQDYQRGQNIVLRNVQFEYNSATFKNDSFKDLEALVKTLNRNKNMSIEISGHSSFDKGDVEEENQTLSEDRAYAVYEYLIDHGIDADRLS